MIEIAGLILYAPKDIEDTLGINSRIQARYRNKGLLPFRKMGSSIFYTQSDIRDFLENTKISSVAIKSVKNKKDRLNEDDGCNGDKEITSEKEFIVNGEGIKHIPDQQNIYHNKNTNQPQEDKSDIKSNTDTLSRNSNPIKINLNDSYLTRDIDDIKSSGMNNAESSSMQQASGHVFLLGNNAQTMQHKENPNFFKDLDDTKLEIQYETYQ